MNEPEKGFYYHYKHDPGGTVNNYAYEVVGVARHTELQDPAIDKLVIYRKIDKSDFYGDGKYLGARPLGMFLETVMKGEEMLSRFTKITDPAVIAELVTIRDRMYSDSNLN